MLKGVENSVEQVNNKLTENSDSKSTIRDTILVMRDLMPKMDDFYTRVLPVMEDLKKLHRQTADQVDGRIWWLLNLTMILTWFCYEKLGLHKQLQVRETKLRGVRGIFGLWLLILQKLFRMSCKKSKTASTCKKFWDILKISPHLRRPPDLQIHEVYRPTWHCFRSSAPSMT